MTISSKQPKRRWNLSHLPTVNHPWKWSEKNLMIPVLELARVTIEREGSEETFEGYVGGTYTHFPFRHLLIIPKEQVCNKDDGLFVDPSTQEALGVCCDNLIHYETLENFHKRKNSYPYLILGLILLGLLAVYALW